MNFLSRIGISKYLNMHKSRYKLPKRKNKCEVTIKSTITKRTTREGKWLKKKSLKRDKIGERERED